MMKITTHQPITVRLSYSHVLAVPGTASQHIQHIRYFRYYAAPFPSPPPFLPPDPVSEEDEPESPPTAASTLVSLELDLLPEMGEAASAADDDPSPLPAPPSAPTEVDIDVEEGHHPRCNKLGLRAQAPLLLSAKSQTWEAPRFRDDTDDDDVVALPDDGDTSHGFPVTWKAVVEEEGVVFFAG